MDHQKTQLKLITDNPTEHELDSVAAAIRPLPREVEPSQEFLGELRLRLLKLEPTRSTGKDSRRAA